MEKYGIVHEMECTCGEKVLLPDSDKEHLILKKHAEVGKSTHIHKFTEVTDDGGKKESGDVRAPGPSTEGTV